MPHWASSWRTPGQDLTSLTRETCVMGENASEAPRAENASVCEAGPSDRSLLRRFRRGEEDAATLLYLRYADRLRALTVAQCSPDLAQRVDADDIVQSVFRTFFRRAAQG